MRTAFLLALFFTPLMAQDAMLVNLPVETQTAGAWHIAKASVELPRDAVSPKLILAPQRDQSKIPNLHSFVSVRFEIDEQGSPVRIQVDKSSDKELEAEVIAMIREWRFAAALRGGKPMAAHAYIDLSGGDLTAGIGRRPVHHRSAVPAPQ